jgi:Flp pilus assembly protein TadD
MASLMRWLLAAVVMLGMAAPASAAWHEARSKHFIIYADENPRRLLDYATRLEKFDAAARAISGLPDPPIGDGNRLTVFVMPTAAEVRQLAGEKGDFLEGFYTGRASGSLAYAASPRGATDDFDATSVFYHEYAHHLMMQQLDHAYPEWYVEGYAEFLSTPKFNRDGSVQLGNAPRHRAWGLFYGESLPLEALLGGTYGDIRKLAAEQRESVYGRGWLLVHYLFMEPKRKGQVERYIGLVTQGMPAGQAATAAFGDLKQLDRELHNYLNRKRIMTLQVPPTRLQTGPIDVRPLSPGGAQVVRLRARLKLLDSKAQVEPVAAQLRQLQARFPGDELVEVTLAEAELKATRHEAAQAAADRALTANPRNTEAMILKGKAILERASSTDEGSEALFAQARKTFIAANKIDAEDPEPLMEFYHAYVIERRRPTANAIAALHYASRLAPQDLGLRMNSAIAHLNEGKMKDARATLMPVAFSPHGGSAAETARRMIAKIDSGDAQAAIMVAAAGSGQQ